MKFIVVVFVVYCSSLVRGDLLCTDCKKLVTNSVEFISNTEMEGKIQNVLDAEVCARLDESYRPTCEFYIMAFIPPVFQYLKDHVTPQFVCANETHLCPGESTTHTQVNIPEIQSKLSGQQSNLTCEFCELITNEVRLVLQLPVLQTGVEEAVSKLCNELPVDQDTCSTFVDTNSKKIFNLLAEGLKGSVVCPEVGFCASHVHQILVAQ